MCWRMFTTGLQAHHEGLVLGGVEEVGCGRLVLGGVEEVGCGTDSDIPPLPTLMYIVH